LSPDIGKTDSSFTSLLRHLFENISKRVIRMEFLDDLGRRLGEVARQVEEKSEELFEIGKINIRIFREEEAIRRLSRRIGEIVYKAYSDGSEYGGLVDEQCSEISERKQRIAGLRLKIEEIKNAGRNAGTEAEPETPGDDPPVCEVQ